MHEQVARVRVGVNEAMDEDLLQVRVVQLPRDASTADPRGFDRRLGLTATLVREDGGEDDVFTLIGPKRYDVPWKDLERQGWIATARCTEIRIPLTPESRRQWVAPERVCVCGG